MKPCFYFLLLFGILVSSCGTYQPYLDSSLDLPLRLGNDVEVFYPGESIPHKEYVEVGSIAVREGLSKNETQYVNRLKRLAQNTGVDALIEVKKVYVENLYNDDPHCLYTGTGIKYLKNLNYLDEYIREESFYTLNDSDSLGDKELSAVIERTPSGRILASRFLNDKASSDYTLYVQGYRDYHLLEEQKGWTYKKDSYDKLTMARRYTRQGAWKVKTCKYRYKEEKLDWINIYHHDPDRYSKVYYSYDDQGRVSSREIELFNHMKIRENYNYNEQDRLIRKEYVVFSTSLNIKQSYMSEYIYYTKEDIHEFISF